MYFSHFLHLLLYYDVYKIGFLTYFTVLLTVSMFLKKFD